MPGLPWSPVSLLEYVLTGGWSQERASSPWDDCFMLIANIHLHQGMCRRCSSCIGEMVSAFTKFSCSRLSHHRSKHHHFVDERIGGSRVSPAAALHGMPPYLGTFEAVEYFSEPVDVDQPARCPPPERSIMRDGLMWKEMVARRSEKALRLARASGAMAGLQAAPPPPPPPWRRRILSSPREKYLFITHSAPERVVSSS